MASTGVSDVVCACTCGRVCVRVCVRACVHVRARVCVRACVFGRGLAHPRPDVCACMCAPWMARRRNACGWRRSERHGHEDDWRLKK
jgi:hypothetical protein